jgi:hypothetical protein
MTKGKKFNNVDTGGQNPKQEGARRCHDEPEQKHFFKGASLAEKTV